MANAIYQKDLYTTPQPLTATKGKDINESTYTYIIKGDNTNKTDAELALLCKQYASSAVKIYRNTTQFAVIVFKKITVRPAYEINRYGKIKPTSWAVRNYFGI